MIRRSAFTLLELLVVIAIIGVLIALLLPSVLSAREAGRRVTCANNIRQLALAVQAYHEMQKELPPMYTSPPSTTVTLSFGLESHSWRSMILHCMEGQQLQDQIDLELTAIHANNRAAINSPVDTFVCPSAPRSSSVVRNLWQGRSQFNADLTAAAADYNASNGFIETGIASRQSLCDPSVSFYYVEETKTLGVFGEVVYGKAVWDPPTVQPATLGQITDGLSRTIMLYERAGLPDQHFEGRAKFEPHDPPTYRTWGNVGLWAISGTVQFNQVYHQTNKPLVNYDNMLGLYAFHPGGAHVALADGSVQLLSLSVSSTVVLASLSRAGNESLNIHDAR
jgi:prepilin-type N-terminal cleavage/methylation domain-containing protein/prepilin-type processing-associated H-X9-DG protein